jgi:lysophospholipase L1-like esterase
MSRFTYMPGRAAPAAMALVAVIASGCTNQPRPHLAPSGSPVTRIVFVGDSLVHRSAADHGMLDAVRDELAAGFPSTSFEVVDAGSNGDRIADILRRIDEDVIALHPDAVVLYWDSDVSDVDEAAMKPHEVRRVRAAYEHDVQLVLQRLVASGAYVIMSGPTLIGERPHPGNPKDRQLDHYRDINRSLAGKASIQYIDTRRTFQGARPAGSPRDADRGLLTEDGEHLNASGARLAASLFGRALRAWLGQQPAGDPPGDGVARLRQ